MSGADLSALGGTMAAALWLGLVAAISPCPLASNIAAIGFVARLSGGQGWRNIWLPGALYAFGRALAYTVVGAAITWGLLAAPAVSTLLQRHLSQLMGPVLVLVGMALLGLLPAWRSPIGGGGSSWNDRLLKLGLTGCTLMGFVFALSFCPVSGALFFGSLLPLAVRQQSAWLVPALFGIGSAAPVLVFAVALAIGRETAGRFVHGVQKAERWLGPTSGWLLVSIGVWLCLRQNLRLF